MSTDSERYVVVYETGDRYWRLSSPEENQGGENTGADLATATDQAHRCPEQNLDERATRYFVAHVSEYEQARDAERYEKAWPDHCVSCNGHGGHPDYYDPSPVGVSLGSGSFVEWESCPECLERWRCPRCGGGVISEVYWDEGLPAICDGCGYIEGTTGGHPGWPDMRATDEALEASSRLDSPY